MVSKASDILEFISWQTSECLNENPQHTLDNALKQVCATSAGCFGAAQRSGVVPRCALALAGVMSTSEPGFLVKHSHSTVHGWTSALGLCTISS